MKLTLRIVRFLILIYLGLMLFLGACQNRLLYYPTKAPEAALLKQAQAEGVQPWRNRAGELIGWHSPNPTATRRIIVFHGNAGYALHRTYYVEGLSPHGWEVFLFEYPGYGARGGSPGRDAFLPAARQAIEELLRNDTRSIYLLGESIGSGTAAALAGENPDKIRGAIFVIPFARLVEVAKAHFPFLPIGLLLRDKFDNLAALEKYRRPIAVAVAENDEIINPEQGRKLHAGYEGPKLLITFPGATHNEFPTAPSAPWWKQVTDFLATQP